MFAANQTQNSAPGVPVRSSWGTGSMPRCSIVVSVPLLSVVGVWDMVRFLLRRRKGGARDRASACPGDATAWGRGEAGQLPARDGTVQRHTPLALLDQQLLGLSGECSILDSVQAANPSADPGELRTRLALLGLDAQRIQRAASSLSDGERVKGALASVLYADPAPQLLLLDEPGNALDLSALQALEELLAAWPGALVMVSHDRHLLQALRPTQVLHVSTEGWQWHDAL